MEIMKQELSRNDFGYYKCSPNSCPYYRWCIIEDGTGSTMLTCREVFTLCKQHERLNGRITDLRTFKFVCGVKESKIDRRKAENREKNAMTYEHVCKQCGKTFADTRKESIYCSADCYHRKRKLPRKICVCEYCGKEFLQKKHCGIQKYCSHVCAGKGSRNVRKVSNSSK